MKKYPTYKPSNVAWLGDVPSHWEMRKIKTLFKEVNERSFDGSEDLLSVSQYTGITKKSDKIQEGDLLTNALTLEGYKIVKVGDLVSNIMLAWNGSLGFSPFDGITSPAYAVYRLKTNGINKYFHYLFRTEIYKAEFKRQSSGIIESRLRLYTDNFFGIFAIYPPLSEQTAIADYLDAKTAQIATAIALKSEQIAKLKEYRQTLINDTVTKGLNPNATMKNSGVAWLGDVPEHWEVAKVKHFLEIPITDGPHTTPVLLNDGIPFISAEAIKDGKIDFEKKRGYISEKDYDLFSKKYIPKRNDIYMVKSGATTGNIALVETDKKFTIWSPLAVFRANKNKLHFKFLFFFLQSPSFMKGIALNWSFGTQQNIGMGILGNLPCVTPPLSEQTAIADYLDAKTAQIDKTINQYQAQMERLKEYQERLISDVVTGKIRVENLEI